MFEMVAQDKIALAIHGGAGTILRSLMTAELEKDYRTALEKSLSEGWEILQKGGSALDAVETAVVVLEDCPLFNAGKGSVFTHEGKNELDAAVMDGRRFRAGAVAFIRNVKNPVKLARLVMERTPHIFLAGTGAMEFAREMKVELAPDKYFFTDFRWQQLENARSEGRVQLDHTIDEPKILEEVSQFETNSRFKIPDSKPIGTVGAVACDIDGNLAAATSTGGMTNKQFGRVGDTPIIGAGTFADNATCAVSCTGHGEYFMLTSAANDVSARMKYKNLSLAEAAEETIEDLTKIGGEGGLIAVDSNGNVALPFNSEGMYRGFIQSDGKPVIDIYR
ncbi:MAG TPA: isoaspartyl peptidase/L-asparaginase [Pyrinomonadaceae bacterium]|nr:isoaspartyl peptidase/L-asparaginase [Pyrinomonadaceae bacterium]